MAEDKKVGPSATYVGEDSNAVTVQGVVFERNKSVNVLDLLGPERGQKVLDKLAGNQFFKVDGGPDHEKRKKEREEQAKRLEEERVKRRDERVQKAEAERQERREGRRANQLGEAALPPEGYKGPDKPTLERPKK